MKQREATVFRQRIASFEKRIADLQQRHEDEFAGVHPTPILLIDPHVEKAKPWIFRVRPSELNGSGGEYWIGAQGKDGPKLRKVEFDTRLLRSIDDIDFFRIVYRVDGQPAKQILFEYDGKPQLLSASDSISIVIAPSPEACIDIAINARKPADRARLADTWTTGDDPPLVQNANLRVRPLNK
ncbi:MAG: hypothetical protein AAFV88_18890 [Planctomycetota bacterium]